MTAKTEPQHATVWAAFAAAQAEFKAPQQSGRNPHFSSKYSTLGDIFAATLPALHKHGLAFMQSIDSTERPNGVELLQLRSMIIHGTTGESIVAIMPLAQDPNPQKFGSTISYMKRYSAAAMFAVVDGMDDDAEAVSAPQRAQTAQRTTKGQNGASAPVADAQAPNDEPVMPDWFGSGEQQRQLNRMHALGQKAYGAGDWNDKRHALVKAITGGVTDRSKELSQAELSRMCEGIEKVIEKS